MTKIDEGKEMLSKKENKKLYEIEFVNNYYNKYADLQEILDNAFSDLDTEVDECMKIGDLKSLYKFSTCSIKIINQAINNAKKFYNETHEEYRSEFRKIAKACDSSLEKEKKTFDINIEIINREKNIAIEDEESKMAIAKKNAIPILSGSV